MLLVVLTMVTVSSVQIATAQVGSPFDLTPRLDTTKVIIPVAQLPPSRVTIQATPAEKRNPFDLARSDDGATNAAPAPTIKLPNLPGVSHSDEESVSRGTFDTILCFSFLVLLAFATVLRGGTLRKIFSASLNANLLSQLQREPRKFGYYLWGILGLLVLGSFLFATSRHLYPGLMDYGWSTLGWFVAAVLCLTGLKLLALEVLKAIFPVGKPVTNYQVLIIVYAGVVGVCVFPALVLISFSTSGLATFIAYASLGIVGLAYTLRSLRAVIDSSRFLSNYPLHFLLYLCGLEIGPLAVAFKLLTT
ncbi:MAG: DUF4271 domain-containing protein [Saprospiraceae bacterium]